MSEPIPKVTVLMPVYNAEKFLKAALDSVLWQEFEDYELLAINDGSTDNSGNILDEYAERDQRVRVIHQENMGLVKTLNKGLNLAKGEYIARVDSDDMCMGNRFMEQVKEFEKDATLVLVGTSFEVFTEEDTFLYFEFVTTEDEDIRRAMYVRNPIGHGTTMFRKSAALEVGVYSYKFGPTEDFALWRAMADVGKIKCLPMFGYRWRINPDGVTMTKTKVQEQQMEIQLKEYWESNPPAILTASELRQQARRYFTKKRIDGVSLKYKMLHDNMRIGFKMMRRGRFFGGLRQVLNVVLVGRSGVKVAFHRLGIVSLNVLRNAVRGHNLHDVKEASETRNQLP